MITKSTHLNHPKNKNTKKQEELEVSTLDVVGSTSLIFPWLLNYLQK